MKNFPAVSIVAPSGCCPAVKELTGRKVLAKDAPRLPLAECSDPAKCKCRFQKHSDRRGGDDDRRLFTTQQRSVWFSGSQRRKSSGRRSDDV
jgi:hypothetical protein